MHAGDTRGLTFALLVLAGPALANAAPEPAPRPVSPYSSAKSCGACHDQIFKAWSDSPHARSATSPAYLEALKRASESTTDARAAREVCVWCHAPTTILTHDLELQQPISREGITCDFCHTVADVDLDRSPPFDLQPGPVKRGPFAYSKVQGHQAAYSSLHRASPLLCASCHEFRNARGVLVLSNYSEWKNGPYPVRGVSCQDCHMALIPGAPARIAGPQGSQRYINAHRLLGGSSISQLARGLDLKIESVTVSGESADVTVTVANSGAGHSVPGGLATKTLVLVVGAESAGGKLEYPQERTYRRELKDDKGVVLESVADMFLRAASIGLDTRIKPNESRRERFRVPVPAGERAIVARLEYRDATDPRSARPTITAITEVRHPLSSSGAPASQADGFREPADSAASRR